MTVCVLIISLYRGRFCLRSAGLSSLYREYRHRRSLYPGFCLIPFTVTFAGTQTIHRYTGNIVIPRIVISGFRCRKSGKTKWPTTPALIPVSVALSDYEYFYSILLPLMGPPQSYPLPLPPSALTQIVGNTLVESNCESKVSCPRTRRSAHARSLAQ